MKNREQLSEEIDQTMNSLDGLSRATPGPFFYTRLKARMDSESIAARTASWYSWLLKPQWSLAMVAFLLVLNVGAILWYLEKPQKSQTDYIESLSGEISGSSSDYQSFYNL
ncbi:MAG: hypothetical protein R3D00_20575 [Bacteroidia bacterium]